jgi:hypothetical protein
VHRQRSLSRTGQFKAQGSKINVGALVDHLPGAMCLVASRSIAPSSWHSTLNQFAIGNAGPEI